MKVRLSCIAIIFSILLLQSCTNFGPAKKSEQKQAEGIPKDFDYGKIENNRYTNSYFDMAMNVPVGWRVQSKEQAEKIMKKGEEMVAGDNENLKAIMRASDVNTANLLVVFKHEVGAAVDYNPIYMLVAENLKNTPGVKTGGDYLFHASKLLKQGQMQYDSMDSEFGQTTINGVDFYVMNAMVKYMGLTVRQKFYSTIMNGFALNAIISYSNRADELELTEAIESIQFKK
jgi:hypothetical protein